MAFVCSLGGSWLEGNFPAFLALLLELPSSGRARQTPADAALTRRCVSSVLRSAVDALPGDKAQMSAATQLSLSVAAHEHGPGELRSIASVSGCVEPDPVTSVCPEGGGGDVESRASCGDAAARQHAPVCCLQELGALLLRLGASASPLLAGSSSGVTRARARAHAGPCIKVCRAFTALLDPVLSFLLHPAASVSLAAAWSLRCVAVAMPSQGSQLLDHCCQRLMALKSAPEAVLGYGAAVAALVSALQHCPLGVPHTKSSVSSRFHGNKASAHSRSKTASDRTAVCNVAPDWLLLLTVCVCVCVAGVRSG